MQLLPKLEAAHQDWLRGEAIMRELAQFYFEGGYMRYHQAIENGLDVDLHTQGECSIMSEDTLGRLCRTAKPCLAAAAFGCGRVGQGRWE